MYQGNISLSADQQNETSQSSQSKRSYTCNHHNCGKVFRFKSEIVRHQATHAEDRPFVCEFEGCGKSFKRADALENHIRTHTGETPFVCEFEGCGMGFTTKASLRYHVLKHKNNKIFKCTYPGCNKSFITLFQLKQHEKSVNVHKKINSRSEDESKSPCSHSTYDRAGVDSESSESYMNPLYETHKMIETEFLSSPSNCQFEERTSSQFEMEFGVQALKTENEALRQRLEMSEKLLYMFLQQQMPIPAPIAKPIDPCNLYLNQSTKMSVPEPAANDNWYGFSGFNTQFEDIL